MLAKPRDLARINEKLRLLLLKVVIDWENNRLIMHWRHGAQSYTPFYRRRLRGTARNKTPELTDNMVRFRPSGSWPPPEGAYAISPEEKALTVGAHPVVSVRLTGKRGEDHQMILDAEDWSQVKFVLGAEWTLKDASGRVGYVVSRRRTPANEGGPRLMVLARWITGAGRGTVVTYRDGNSLNLTRKNLEVVGQREFSPRDLSATPMPPPGL